MTDRELMQQALEALVYMTKGTIHGGNDLTKAAITALRERLAQHSEMDKAIAAGDGTLHGAIDYWQEEARRYAQNADFWRSEAEKTQPEMQPCAGRNCGSTNPNLHSAECFEDYEKSTGMVREHVIDCPRCGHCCPQS